MDMSSNGTYVNGTKLVKGTASALRHGDKIHIFKPKTKKVSNLQRSFYCFPSLVFYQKHIFTDLNSCDLLIFIF